MSKATDSTGTAYLPALAFHGLNCVYDQVVRLTTRDRAHRRALLRQAAVRPGERVLDAGCGSGTTAILLGRLQPECRIAALDADLDMLRRGHRKAARAGVRVSFVCGYVQQSQFRPESFDCVLSGLLFHHLKRDAKLRALAELKRVLRNGGRLHIVDWGVPANPLLGAAFLLVRLLDGFDVTEDNARGRLASLLEHAGFASVESCGRMSTPLGTLEFMSALKHETPALLDAETTGASATCT